MDTEKMLMGISQVEEDLMKFRFEINKQSYNGHEKLFRGADIAVVDENTPLIHQRTDWLDNDERIITPFSLELSWAIFKLRYIFYSKSLVNYVSKYEFFGRLGGAANRYHQKYGPGNVDDLLAAVSKEAHEMLKEMLMTVDPAIT
jgi:hypothetical protein